MKTLLALMAMMMTMTAHASSTSTDFKVAGGYAVEDGSALLHLIEVADNKPMDMKLDLNNKFQERLYNSATTGSTITLTLDFMWTKGSDGLKDMKCMAPRSDINELMIIGSTGEVIGEVTALFKN